MLKDRIEHWYIDEDCNCAESMLHAISEEYGMNFDHDDMTMVSAFGGGVGSGLTCGAMAASMAAVLMVAGEKGKRFALKHSRIMIHQPLGGVQGQASDIEITAREILKLKNELYTIIANHSGQPIERIEKDSDRDHWMTSAEAVEYGMIDQVLERTIG